MGCSISLMLDVSTMESAPLTILFGKKAIPPQSEKWVLILLLHNMSYVIIFASVSERLIPV